MAWSSIPKLVVNTTRPRIVPRITAPRRAEPAHLGQRQARKQYGSCLEEFWWCSVVPPFCPTGSIRESTSTIESTREMQQSWFGIEWRVDKLPLVVCAILVAFGIDHCSFDGIFHEP